VIASETAYYPDGSIWYRIGDVIPCEWEGIWDDRALRRDEWEMQQALAREAPRPLLAGLGLWPTLPALSVQCPTTVTEAPSGPEYTVGSSQDAIPLGSTPVHVMVRVSLYQPLTGVALSKVPVTVGGTPSMTVMVTDAMLLVD